MKKIEKSFFGDYPNDATENLLGLWKFSRRESLGQPWTCLEHLQHLKKCNAMKSAQSRILKVRVYLPELLWLVITAIYR
jgi:hypothetical protein